jgi:hypothetical protein
MWYITFSFLEDEPRWLNPRIKANFCLAFTLVSPALILCFPYFFPTNAFR